MQVAINDERPVSIERQPFEAVERKGIGHPDSLADLIAEAFSIRYSQHCLSQFGYVANHWVDKVNLVGAIANVRFGSFDIVKPVTAYLFGKVTERVGGQKIDIEGIFKCAVLSVFAETVAHPELANHLRLKIENNDGIGIDHNPEFYRPSNTAALDAILRSETVANDSVICNAYAGLSGIERLAIWVENYINSHEFHLMFPMIGSDVKVLIVRFQHDIDITLCIPLHPELTPDARSYYATLADAKEILQTRVHRHLEADADLHAHGIGFAINTKDHDDRVYLTPFGTALGKGDCGAVGRGNRFNGVISGVRPSNVEAVAGKNPIHHAGKLYNAITQTMAIRVFQELGFHNHIVIVARNGGELSRPAYVSIDVQGPMSHAQHREIEKIIDAELARMSSYSDALVTADPIDRFRHPFRRVA